MNLKTRLVLAFFLLAVVPISLLTYFGFQSSKRALRSAVERESAQAAEELGEQMQLVMSSLDEKLDRLGDLELPALGERPNRGDADWRRFYEAVQERVGDAVPLLESLEFSPFGKPEPHPTAVEGASPPPPPPSPAPPPASPSEGRASFRFHFPAGPPNGRWDVKVERSEGEEQVFILSPGSPPTLPPTPDRRGDQRKLAEKAVAEKLGRLAERERRLAEQAAAAGRQLSQGDQKAGAVLDEVTAELAKVAGKKAELDFIFQRQFDSVVQHSGKPWARIHAQVNPVRVLSRVFKHGAPRGGEILFAVDAEGRLYTPEPEGQEILASLGLPEALRRDDRTEVLQDWVVVTRHEPRSGATLGIARPIAAPLREMRRAAFLNLGLGLGLLTLAVLGILPLSNRITRNLRSLTKGAEQLAKGDLETRVPVRSNDEFGRLAGSFNQMAVELKAHQQRLVEQERLRKELEMCRRIQEEMLPRTALRLPFAEARGISIPAREVGGDFFNYFSLPDGKVGILVGDVSGKGVPAALLMANIQATLRARLTSREQLHDLARQLDQEISEQTPGETYLTLFLGVFSPDSGTLRWVNAGHNTQYALRSDGRLQALKSTGRPLGLLPGGDYAQQEVDLQPGDTLFLYTDGLVEAENPSAEQFGDEKLEAILRESAESGIDELLKRLEEAVRLHRNGAEAGDDATLVALKIESAAKVSSI